MLTRPKGGEERSASGRRRIGGDASRQDCCSAMNPSSLEEKYSASFHNSSALRSYNGKADTIETKGTADHQRQQHSDMGMATINRTDSDSSEEQEKAHIHDVDIESAGFKADDHADRQARQDDSPLDSPLSAAERAVHGLLKAFESRYITILKAILALGIVISGAMFFFLLVGLQPRCRPRRDCEPRNTRYLTSIQVMTGFLTCVAILTLPWRFVHLCHALGIRTRTNKLGHDLKGLPTRDVFYSIPRCRRIVALTFLVLQCVFQFVNQYMRHEYNTLEEQGGSPWSSWTSSFFAASLTCGAIGASLKLTWSKKTKSEHPDGTFEDDAVTQVLQRLKQYWGRENESETSGSRKEESDDIDSSVVKLRESKGAIVSKSTISCKDDESGPMSV